MRSLCVACVLALAFPAYAANAVVPGTLNVDRPTLTALGVQWLLSGDDNRDASGSIRFREQGTSAWRTGPPLHRVHPENVVAITVPEQVAGSVFDLRPATPYELEVTVHDPDGGDSTRTVTATTRAVPADPASPRARSVTSAATLTTALSNAQPGDVITLADGVYAGAFALNASGTAANPIVIRGTSRDGTVLDGNACSCNVLEVYGSFVHVENLTLRNASRALRFQGQGAEGNVVRRVHVVNVTLGFGSKPDQKDFYLCDNLLEGRLTWPSVYADDSGAHANDDGIHIEGSGHVVCHNDLVGFGDAMKTEQVSARAVDFYGNEVRSCYDNALELDTSEGNTRALRNRFTNCYAPISFQPIYGGPVYAIRNVVVNVVNEQMKFHSLGGTDVTSGIYAWHNTFVSPRLALNLQDNTTAHHFRVMNNLFVGPATLVGTRAIDWSGGIDDGVFDYDGIFPDGRMSFALAGTYTTYNDFAAAQAAGVEVHGRLLTQPVFASGYAAPADYRPVVQPQDVTLAASSNAVDTGLLIPGVNDGYQGAGPDLGALERGCALPIYGVRPAGVDESNETFGCPTAADGGTGGGAGGSGGGTAGGSGGGTGGSGGGGEDGGVGGGAGGGTVAPGPCGCAAGADPAWAALGLCAALVRRRRPRVGRSVSGDSSPPPASGRAAPWRSRRSR